MQWKGPSKWYQSNRCVKSRFLFKNIFSTYGTVLKYKLIFFNTHHNFKVLLQWRTSKFGGRLWNFPNLVRKSDVGTGRMPIPKSNLGTVPVCLSDNWIHKLNNNNKINIQHRPSVLFWPNTPPLVNPVKSPVWTPLCHPHENILINCCDVWPTKNLPRLRSYICINNNNNLIPSI